MNFCYIFLVVDCRFLPYNFFTMALLYIATVCSLKLAENKPESMLTSKSKPLSLKVVTP